MEDFAAHSNYVELALRKIGVDEVFCLVGDDCRIFPPSPHSGLPDQIEPCDAQSELEYVDRLRSAAVPPLVTGTFGELDIYQSLIGEIDDMAATRTRGVLGELSSVSRSHSMVTYRIALTSARHLKVQVQASMPSSMPSKLLWVFCKWSPAAKL